MLDRTILTLERYPDVAYNPTTGQFFRIKNKQLAREIFASEQGSIWVIDSKGKKTTRKAEYLAMEFITAKEIEPNTGVFFKNFDKQDYRSFNLIQLSKEEYTQLKDAMDNLDGALKIKPDKQNPYGSVLFYRHQGKLVKQSFEDVVSATKAKRQILLHSTRLLSRLILTE